MADRTVRARLELITAQYHAALERAGVATTGFGAQVEMLGKRGAAGISQLTGGFVDLSGKSALAAGGIGLLGVATFKFLDSSIAGWTELVGKVDQYQDITGSTAEDSSRMVAVADAFGVSTDTLANAMFRLARNVEENEAALSRYGIEIERNNDDSIDLTGTLASVAEAYQRVGGGQAGARIAQEAFGRGGAALIDILERERSELEAVAAAAEEHGQIVSDEDIAAVREHAVAVEEMNKAWGEFSRSAGALAVPIMTDLAETLTTVHDGIENIVGILPDFGNELRDVLSDIVPFAGGSWVENAANFNPLTGAVYDFVAGTDEAAGSTDGMTTIGEGWRQSLERQEAALEDVTEEVASLDEQMSALLDKEFGVQGATDQLTAGVLDFVRSVRDAKAEGNEFALSLETTSIEGLENRRMLQGMAEDAIVLAGEMAAAGESPVAAMASVREQLIDTAAQLGFNRDEAAEFFDVLLQVGGLTVRPTVDVDTGPARAKLNEFLADYSGFFGTLQAIGAWVTDAPSAAPPVITGGVANVTSGASGGSSSGLSAEEIAEREAREREQAEADFDRAMAARYEFGGLTVDEYKAYLEARIAATEAYTGEWIGLMNELNAVNEEIGQGWRDAFAEQQRIEDAMYETGAISKDAYLGLLKERLAGLQQYSDEWMAVWREIQQIEGEISQSFFDIMDAVEEERQYWQRFIAEQDQRDLQMLREEPAPAVVVQAGGNKTLSFSASVAGSGSVAGDLRTANQAMRDGAFLMGV